MATGAAEMMLQCVINAGSISWFDMEIERRPYHRDCGCALHKLKGVCSVACSQQRNISFQKKHSWNIECSLSISAASKYSSQPSFLIDSLSVTSNGEDAIHGVLSHRYNRVSIQDEYGESKGMQRLGSEKF